MVDETRECIREAMIGLLKEKDYGSIQMKQIAERAHVGRRTLYRYFDSKEQILEYIARSQMDHLAREILKREPLTLDSVIHAFFVFIQSHRSEFLILKKARLLIYIEDHLFELITHVAAQTKYREMDRPALDAHIGSFSAEDKFALHYIIAGTWRVAMLWLEEGSGLTPDEMTEMSLRIITHTTT